MDKRERQQAELLDNYLRDVRLGQASVPPQELDPEVVNLLHRLEGHVHPSEPEEYFVEQLRHRIGSQPAPTGGDAVGGKPGTLLAVVSPIQARRWLLAGLAVAATIVLTFFSVSPWTSRPLAVSAQEIVERAQAVAGDIAASGLQSFEMAQVATYKYINPPEVAGSPFGAGGETRTDTHVWFQAPDKWRYETSSTPAPGQGTQAIHRVRVADGQTTWSYDSGQNLVQVNAGEIGGPQRGLFSPYGDPGESSPDNLSEVLRQAKTCYNPTITGEERVAGRSAYVVSLGATKCPSASVPAMNGPRTIWIDKETFFVLKSVTRDTNGEQVVGISEVTSFSYNPQLAPDLFTFTPPPGAQVRDSRPQPALSAGQYRQQLADLAKEADFPVFVPRDVPAGLAPRAPRKDPVLPGIELAYVPPDQVGSDNPADRGGLHIIQQRATYEKLINWTDRAEAIQIAGAKGWLRRGVRNADGTGSDSAALLLRDGTLVSISSFTIAPEQLVKIGVSLEPVAGGHAPLPNPTPPTVADIRRQSPFLIFVPTNVPAGLTPEPPVGGRINYHAANGVVALTVFNGRAGCCEASDPRKTGEAVALPNGLTAHLLGQIGAQFGGYLLWWEQDGTYIAINGPDLTREDLVRIAASMSAAADLGKVEPPAPRPTPTPVPAPKFTILRPSWLPETATMREQYQSGSPEQGSSVLLGFDPRPDDTQPHGVLTLRELPKAAMTSQGPDAQASKEKIGDRQVTIVRRGESCITLSWEQDEIALILTNPYDPPGHPRYSCDELSRVVESVE